MTVSQGSELQPLIKKLAATMIPQRLTKVILQIKQPFTPFFLYGKSWGFFFAYLKKKKSIQQYSVKSFKAENIQD